MKIDVIYGEVDHLGDIKQPKKKKPFLVIKNQPKRKNFRKLDTNMDKPKKHTSKNGNPCVDCSCPG